jgi:hypothetical protein
MPNRGDKPQHTCFIKAHDGLRLRCCTPDMGVELLHPGAHLADTVCLPFSALADIEGAEGSPVTLRRIDPNEAEANWQHRGVPQTRRYALPQETQAFPVLPQKFASNPPGLLAALDDAMQAAAKVPSKFALDHVQLKGSGGEIVGTDSRQVLCQSGFSFPWSENVLIPRFGRIASKEFLGLASVGVGKTATHVVLQVRPWTFCFRINKDGRFAPVDDIMPQKAPATRLRLDAQDVATLIRALPEMPGSEDGEACITVDLNGHAAIRARASGEKAATELLLNRSVIEGKPVRFCIDRNWLRRAGQLDFDTLGVFSPDRPVLCESENRKYLAMVLSSKCAIASSPDDVRVNSASDEKAEVKPPTAEGPAAELEAIAPHPEPISPAKEENRTMNEQDNGAAQAAAAPAKHGRSLPPARETSASKGESNNLEVPSPAKSNRLEDDAVAIQKDLRALTHRLGQVIRDIRKQRRQHRLVKSTLASIQQLQQVAD